MRIFFAFLLVVAIAGGAWYGINMGKTPGNTTAQTDADNFANSALAALYNASNTSTSSSSVVSGAQASSSAAQDTITNATSTSPGSTGAAQITNPQNYMHATLHTSLGDITIE